MVDLNLPENRYCGIARNCTFLHTRGMAANRHLEKPLKPAEFQVLKNRNFDWRLVYRFWIIPLQIVTYVSTRLSNLRGHRLMFLQIVIIVAKPRKRLSCTARGIFGYTELSKYG